VGVVLLTAASCSSSVSSKATDRTTPGVNVTTDSSAGVTVAPATTAAGANTTTVTTGPASATAAPSDTSGDPPGSQPGLDDIDGDGRLDPTCGTADLGAGLVVRTTCTPFAPQNEAGVVPVPNGALSLAAAHYPELDSVDVTARFARTVDGRRATIFELGSDTLFDTGQAVIKSTATLALPGVVAAINNNLPGGVVLVRGHADSRGNAAANQTLSEQRAQAVATWLTDVGGLNAASVTAVGLGNTQPAALETNPDGSVSDVGQTINRRVEIVVITPN
jgi:outer membrane protein OmpA-like peptidoglycan-associated protein